MQNHFQEAIIMNIEYTANAGQTYMPFQENILVKPLPFTPLPRPEPEIPALELNSMALEKKWIIKEQCQHFGRDPRNAGLVLG